MKYISFAWTTAAVQARCNRKIIVSGAPKEEMPLVRAGAFADRHTLLDAVYRDVMKRQPQIIKRAASKTKSKPADDKDDLDDTDTAQGGADDAAEAPTDDATLENAIIAAQQETVVTTSFSDHSQSAHGEPGAELVNAVGSAWQQEALPLIENDPTLENAQVELAQEMDAEIAEATNG